MTGTKRKATSTVSFDGSDEFSAEEETNKPDSPQKQAKTDKSKTPAQERTGRACLACRKLKSRCEGALDPPCRRCRQTKTECIFVESKRGKRPPKKPGEQALADKMQEVERTLSKVLESASSGAPVDLTTLEALRNYSQEAAAAAAKQKAKAPPIAVPAAASTSPTSVMPNSATSDLPILPLPLPTASYLAQGLPYLPPQIPLPAQQSPIATTSGGLSPQSFTQLAAAPSSVPIPSPYTPIMPALPLPILPETSEVDGTALTLLADVSQGLDGSFKISGLTEALETGGRGGNSPNSNIAALEKMQQAPKILTMGIITATKAVDLFKIYFDFCYIHLPLLDPETSTVTSICTKSGFLFTVICAVASRFSTDTDLDTTLYDQAHICFVDMLSSGERSIESMQACLLLTLWGNAPKGAEDRPRRAWLYYTQAVRLGFELGLFRPPPFADTLLASASSKGHLSWSILKDIPSEDQREAMNRERTWIICFLVDRYMAGVMGRPYLLSSVQPLLLPKHPMSLPLDFGIIAHYELQCIIGKVMDSFKERIIGSPTASDTMPDPTLMKDYNTQMDEWQQRWCPSKGEPFTNNLLFYFYNCKLYLNTFPIQTMLLHPDIVKKEDEEYVKITLEAAKELMEVAHDYAGMNLLQHVPDVQFLYILYAAVFLIKMKVANSPFAHMIDADWLIEILGRTTKNCEAATLHSKHASGTCAFMLRVLTGSFKTMNADLPASTLHSRRTSVGDALHLDHHQDFNLNGLHAANATLAPVPTWSRINSPAIRPNIGSGYFSTAQTPAAGAHPNDPLDAFLNDTAFFSSMLVSQGSEQFFPWQNAIDSANTVSADLGFNAS